ncbi:MAG TPA: cyclic nucleotide-binding domain-containing protein [Thermoplasmata archaeon]|nr:cyclic nucleotide-binding domain-containing protein [Thermoplasmata archaeon]
MSGGSMLAVELANHPFFRGFDREFVEGLAARTTARDFAVDDLLVREGAPAKEFLLIQSGKVALEMATPERPRLTIQTVGPGEVVGWSWLVPPRRWTLDGRALKPTRALDVDGDALRAALDARPELGFQFLSRLLPVIAERLENTRLQLLDIHGI